MPTKKPEMTGVELLDDAPTIDPISSDKDLNKLFEQEKFMEEELKVEVHASSNESDPPHLLLNVNGMNMPVVRGYVTRMKRKYVEVLARMKETKYTQATPNPMQPDNIQMIPRTVEVYPFTVVEDPNPRGHAWLRHIRSEAA